MRKSEIAIWTATIDLTLTTLAFLVIAIMLGSGHTAGFCAGASCTGLVALLILGFTAPRYALAWVGIALATQGMLVAAAFLPLIVAITSISAALGFLGTVGLPLILWHGTAEGRRAREREELAALERELLGD